MIRTIPLGYTHRDAMSRVIRGGDVIAWTNRKQGQGLIFCTVESATEETIRIRKPNNRLTNINPDNCLVITHQVEQNARGNVGANIDLEGLR